MGDRCTHTHRIPPPRRERRARGTHFCVFGQRCQLPRQRASFKNPSVKYPIDQLLWVGSPGQVWAGLLGLREPRAGEEMPQQYETPQRHRSHHRPVTKVQGWASLAVWAPLCCAGRDCSKGAIVLLVGITAKMPLK